MNLTKALKTLIEVKGIDILKSPLSLNILSDYQAFADVPASKNVLKNIIEEGYLEKIAFFYNNKLPIGDAPNGYVSELYNKLGFRLDTSVYVINSILLALGYDEVNVEEMPPSGTPLLKSETQKSSSSKEVLPENDGTHMEFKGIPINGSITAVADAIQNLGYEYVDGREDCILLSGKFAGKDNCQILINASVHTGQVHRVAIFTTPNMNWWGVKSDYDRINEMMRKKYGRPKDKTEFFSSPYELGDGYELTAFQTGNAIYVTHYETSNGSVRVQIAKDGNLLILYVDAKNDADHEAAEGIAAEGDI